MSNTDSYRTRPLDGSEPFIARNERTQYSLLDFWRWSTSDILNNTTRGVLAEYIVSTAVEHNPHSTRKDWDTYDILTPNGVKIEVKSSAYIQSWSQQKHSTISFSIKPTKEWNYNTNKHENIAKRHADIYVFCLLKHTDRATINPLDLDQWEFYVCTTNVLNENHPISKSISLTKLSLLAKPVRYSALKDEINSLTNK